MLLEAVTGRVPLVHVTSTDKVHIEFVLSNNLAEQTGNGLLPYHHSTTAIQPKAVFYSNYNDPKIGPIEEDCLPSLYERFEEAESCLILINYPELPPEALDGGELLPDKDLVHAMLGNVLPSGMLAETTNYLVGLSVQDIKKVLALTPVFYDSLSPDNIRRTKGRLLVNPVGLTRVDTSTAFYYLDPKTNLDKVNWIKQNRSYMYAEVDPRLVPKGILLHGGPGTGKTEMAKHIAREWVLPMFLLDVNAMLTKWQGEAEQHFNHALSSLDKESPCVVLLDEVEKLFQSNSENDTSQRLLGKLLWWLQYKPSKVFVVMTTNDKEILPKELYRPVRIDSAWECSPLPINQAQDFAQRVLQTFTAGLREKARVRLAEGLSKSIAHHLKYRSTKTNLKVISQAEVTQTVIWYLRNTKFGLGN